MREADLDYLMQYHDTVIADTLVLKHMKICKGQSSIMCSYKYKCISFKHDVTFTVAQNN